MSEMVRVAVDAMGGDNAPFEIVKGAVEAVSEQPKLKVYLVGIQEAVEAELAKYTYDPIHYVLHMPEYVYDVAIQAQ